MQRAECWQLWACAPRVCFIKQRTRNSCRWHMLTPELTQHLLEHFKPRITGPNWAACRKAERIAHTHSKPCHATMLQCMAESSCQAHAPGTTPGQCIAT